MKYLLPIHSKDPNHISNGGTFVTRWSKGFKSGDYDSDMACAKTKACVEAYGNPAIFFKDNELHTSDPSKLQAFWNFCKQRRPELP